MTETLIAEVIITDSIIKEIGLSAEIIVMEDLIKSLKDDLCRIYE